MHLNAECEFESDDDLQSERGPTMEIATQSHLVELRNLLTYRLHELQADLHAAQMDRDALGNDTSEPQSVRDTKDLALSAANNEVLMAQAQRDADELAAVEAALHRLDAGRFGDCLECGDPISLARLRVQPAAARCARCQAASERAQTSA
jgi:DnaK suppressor protein